MSGLKQRISELIPKRSQEVKEFRNKYGNKLLGNCSVDQAYSGMRSLKCMVYETSLLDPMEVRKLYSELGIRFRDYTIPEVQKLLPHKLEQPLPEGVIWLLMTGEIPTKSQVDALSAELASRAKLPEHVIHLLETLAKANLHPMSQLVSSISALQSQSRFAKRYASGISKSEYWQEIFEDSLDLISNLPEIASRIYRNTFKDGKIIAQHDPSLDYGANFAHQLGFNSAEFDELMRLYLVIHSDHEGGNVSAHTSRIVSSALSDPYLSYSAAMCGLAGPLHGLANQEVLRWIIEFKRKFSVDPTAEDVKAALWDTLNSGQVIPGYGHAVLRSVDPRYVAQREFALKYLPDDPLFKLVSLIFQVAPEVLTQHGKTKNPWPNVDAHSGCLLMHYGLTEHSFYTVLFGVSRSIGITSNMIWDRIFNLSIERPKSVTNEWLMNNINDSTPNA